MILSKKIIIVGFGYQIITAIDFCKKNNIELFIISGLRQKNSNQIENHVFKKLKEKNFSNIEFVSNLEQSKRYKDLYKGKFDYVISVGSFYI